jgi:hypothetical protein
MRARENGPEELGLLEPVAEPRSSLGIKALVFSRISFERRQKVAATCNQREVRGGGWWNFPTGYDGSREIPVLAQERLPEARERRGAGTSRVAGRKARAPGKGVRRGGCSPGVIPGARTAVVNGAQLLKSLFTGAWFGVERCALERALAYSQARENAGE